MPNILRYYRENKRSQDKTLAFKEFVTQLRADLGTGSGNGHI